MQLSEDMPFKKMLVAVDFSEPSRAALAKAVEMAIDGGAELVLAHVWEPKAHLYGMPAFPVALANDYVARAEKDVEELKREAERKGVRRVSTTVLTGTPWHEIVDLLQIGRAHV